MHIPKVDEVGRWSSYVLVDREIAWRYVISFRPDGSLNNISSSREDAREYDPRYERIIQEVEKEVVKEMKQDKSYGQVGSCHSFWRSKQARLKAKGIPWRSPSELNPNICYD